MNAMPRIPFPHRINPDGSFDSICPTCYRTIGNRVTAEELSKDEQRRTCHEE
jgi:hypothetical protein